MPSGVTRSRCGAGGFLLCASALACGSSGGGAPGAAGPSDAGNDAGPSEFIVLDAARIGSRNGTGWPNVGSASGDVAFDKGPFAEAKLVVDLDTTCFPFEKWTANPPPPGQNWPADCDAFDRSFNIVIADASAEDVAAEPPFEVVHAITPFGGPEHLEVDITDLANGFPGAHRLTADVNAYSDPTGKVTGSNNGWTVSAKLVMSRGAAPRRVLSVVPLYRGVLSSGDVPPAPPVVSFTVPDGTSSGRIEYRASGHGGGDEGIGCVGPAEEFCDHPHHVSIDGMDVKTVRAWRADCATLCTITHGPRFDYCLENPCGDMNSVVAPRANWCPGSMTPPFVWDDLPALTAPGAHTFSFTIMPILPGGNWQVSAIYYAFGS
jgi:hypothetical protein